MTATVLHILRSSSLPCHPPPPLPCIPCVQHSCACKLWPGRASARREQCCSASAAGTGAGAAASGRRADLPDAVNPGASSGCCSDKRIGWAFVQNMRGWNLGANPYLLLRLLRGAWGRARSRDGITKHVNQSSGMQS